MSRAQEYFEKGLSYNEVYEQGRADRDKELSELPNQYSEKLWNTAYDRGYTQGKADAIEKMETIVSEFNDYCDATECLDCWMNSFDKSCLHQWIDKKLEQLKKEHDGR